MDNSGAVSHLELIPFYLLMWLQARGVRASTESTVFAAQDQSLRTRNFEWAVMKTRQRADANCRICARALETVDHLVSSCPVLAKDQYVTRHNAIVAYLHWCLCRRYGAAAPRSSYTHTVAPVITVSDVRLLWEFAVPTDLPISANRPDLIVINDAEKTCLLIDVSVPLDSNIVSKFAEKKLKYHPLKLELERLWKVSVVIVPVIIGALGCMTVSLPDSLKTLGCGSAREVQALAIKGTVAILRQVLGWRPAFALCIILPASLMCNCATLFLSSLSINLALWSHLLFASLLLLLFHFPVTTTPPSPTPRSPRLKGDGSDGRDLLFTLHCHPSPSTSPYPCP